MRWLGNIFPCWGSRKHGGRKLSAAQYGSNTNRGSGELTDFVGEMPPYLEEVKPAQGPYYVNGVKNQTLEKKPIDTDSNSLSDQSTVVSFEVQTTEKTPINLDSDSLSDQSTVVGLEIQNTEQTQIKLDSGSLSGQVTVTESIEISKPDHHEDLQFCGSTNALPVEPSGKLMATFLWTKDVCPDSLELVDVIPGSDKKSGLVEGIFRYKSSLVPIFIPSRYAEQRQCQPRHCGTSQVDAPMEESPTDHKLGNESPLPCSTGFLALPPTPPTTPTPREASNTAQSDNFINCTNWGAFAAWAQAPSPYQESY
ncbi:hypothetical protein ASPCAL15049 [Aspergillus calidoustus]|uniref:Uncharacterized protein n=1 Tax=Aspergillus calidoustus TaxID=454130 RepID=A0A0U5GJP2_ASPCI|nr:hypothetical protein ASPCAL15049 [Aspergillus calidoustus]